MKADGRGCAFCGAAGDLVPMGVLDEKWSRRFGGEPVVALDHGWYTTVSGEHRPMDHLDPAKFFGPHVRALCDYCAHGWVEDVRWRAEPTLLALAQGKAQEPARGETAALSRWAQLTAMLAELVEGMPRAASPSQRDAVRRATTATPALDTWVFPMRQRLPARVHLSQVALRHGQVGADPTDSDLVQIVSVDLAQVSTLVLLPSSEEARALVDAAQVADALGAPPGTAPAPLDLSRTRHPHAVAVQRLCAASEAGVC